MSLPRGVSNSFIPACRLVSTSFITACRGVSKSFVIVSRRLSKQIFRYCLSGSERILRHFRLVNRFRGVDTSFSVQSCSLPLNKSFVFSVAVYCRLSYHSVPLSFSGMAMAFNTHPHLPPPLLKLGPVLKKSSLGPRHQRSHLPRRTFTKASTTASTGHKRGGHYNTSEGTRGVLDGYARKQEQ